MRRQRQLPVWVVPGTAAHWGGQTQRLSALPQAPGGQGSAGRQVRRTEGWHPARTRGHRRAFTARAEELLDALQVAAGRVGAPPGPVGRAVTETAALACALAVAGGVTLIVLTEEGPESNVRPGTAAALADSLSARDVTVVLLRPAGDVDTPSSSSPSAPELEEARS